MFSIISSFINLLKHILEKYLSTLFKDDEYEYIETKTRNLLTLNQEERESFINSFDHVILDCDGVLWTNKDTILGVDDSLAMLAAQGKQLHFLTNNSIKSFNEYKSMFEKVGVDINNENLLYPSKVLVNYLRSKNFNKKVFVIGTTKLITDLEAAGISCVTAENEIQENLQLLLKSINDDESVGAVFLDFDVNMNYVKLNKTINLLKRPEVMFLVGATDNQIHVSENLRIIGSGAFVDIIAKYSKRTPTLMGKPGQEAKDIIMKQFNITKPERTLFIGDSLDTDMAFANMCNFQKLLVFTGVSTPHDIVHNKDVALNPDYTLDSLSLMSIVLSSVTKSTSQNKARKSE